ncbi:hypothetical protein Tco_1238075 [Tanacetum coccineum]
MGRGIKSRVKIIWNEVVDDWMNEIEAHDAPQGNGYQEKDKNKDKTGQSRAREWNEREKTSPKSQSQVKLEGNSDDTCDVPVCDDSSTFDALNDNSEILSDSNNDGTSSDDDDYEDVEFEEMNDVDQEEKEFDFRIIFSFNPTPDRVLKSPSLFPIPVVDSDAFLEESDTSLTHLDNSLPEFKTSSNHTEETEVA